MIVRTNQSESIGDNQSQDPLVSRSLKEEIVTRTQILPREELLKEGKSLADRAYLKYIPTPKAAFRPEDHEEKGMVLKGVGKVAGARHSNFFSRGKNI
jgi:hypothetical protein